MCGCGWGIAALGYKGTRADGGRGYVDRGMWVMWVCRRGNVGNIGTQTGEYENAGQVLGTAENWVLGANLYRVQSEF
jgi:hypothetical protein